MASDPRDKVYGILGLFHHSSLGIAPDYNLTVAQVYTDLVVTHIRMSGKISIICFMSNGLIRGEKIPGLPTWVPDFSNVADLTHILIDGITVDV